MDAEKTRKMPVLFIGHGSPINVIESNPFTDSLKKISGMIMRKPKAIMVISAHWLTRGTYVSTTGKPETIYDFYGFPEEMYEIKYPAPGAPYEAEKITALIPQIKEDSRRGLDHGAWTILKHIFPDADIPVFQLSIDYDKPMQYHFDLAQKLKKLREENVLIIGSGNIVHNLRFTSGNVDEKPFKWAVEFDEFVKDRISSRDFASLINYEKFGDAALLSIPTADHYIPLLYCLALACNDDDIAFLYEEVYGALSMRCLKIG